MPPSRRVASRVVQCGLAVLVVATAACSSHSDDAAPPTIEPAQAAVSPVASAPDGRVLPLSSAVSSSTFDPATKSLVVLSGPPGAASTVSVFSPARLERSVALPAPATAMTGDGAGTVFLATRGGYLRLAVATATVTKVGVADRADTDFTAIARRRDGRIVLGSADGHVYTLRSDDAVGADLGVFARVDALVTRDDTTVVLDRSQTSVTTVDTDGTRARHALRAGEGATTMTVDPMGRVLVADTRGGQLLVFGADPLMLRQSYPVSDAPYGLAGSTRLAWVSQTASNAVIGYDLATGIPVEKVRHRTVRQPNSLAYDDTTDTLFVASGVGAGVQVIAGAGAESPKAR